MLNYCVLDLTDERGLLAGMMLADLGADVLQIEPPAGSSARKLGPFAGDNPGLERSLFWWAYARNKRGLTLNIESPGGKDLLRRLVESADVLIESFPPGYLAGLGLGYDQLAALNPRLVVTSITPFGQTGPKADWPASDLTVMSASVAQAASGDSDRAPLGIAVPQAFLHAGAEAAVGTQIALRERKRSGLGQHVDVSAQQAAAACTQAYILAEAWNENAISRASGGVRLGPIQTRFTYPAKDGYVSCTFLFGPAIGPASKRLIDWAYEEGLCDEDIHEKDYIGYTALLLSGQEPISELYRIYDTVANFTATKTKAELFEGALERQLVLAPVATIEDTWQNEHFTARDYWQPASDAGGPRFPGPFAKLSETPIQYRRPAPQLGEHNAEVYSDELGLNAAELALLSANGVI